MQQTALITGATAGIGKACAELLGEKKYDLVLTGRRQERLKEIANSITSRFAVKVKTLAFDISDRRAVEASFSEAADMVSRTTVLINNAGLALGTDPMPKADVGDWDQMIDINVKGLLYATRWILPHMLERKEGHIVNMGSVAGRWLYSGGGVYCASKFAVRALSEGLRMDLMGSGIRVTNIEPGMVETEFSEVRFQGDKAKAQAVYKGMTPLSARDIAETIHWCLERPKHVNIQELVIFPTDQAGVGPNYTFRR